MIKICQIEEGDSVSGDVIDYSPSVTKSQRAHGLDLLRAVLILIGIPYHTGLLLGGMDWVYNSVNHKSEIIPLLSSISHLFRMEVFFFISGYFCYLVIEKKGEQFFWQNRLSKILIPLLTATLVVAIPQCWLVWRVSADHHVGSVVSHLWFLYCLFIISALVLKYHSRISQVVRLNIPVAAVILSVMAIMYGCVIASKLIPAHFPLQLREYLKIPVLTVHYLPYFLLGYAFKAGAGWAKRWMSLPLWLSLSAYVLMNVFYFTFRDASFFKFIKPTLEALIPLAAIPFIFNLFLWDGFKRSPLVDFITHSALVVYVFHHPFVILYGYLLDPQAMSAVAYYLSVIALSVLSSVSLYLLLRRIPAARLGFGIK